MNYLIKVKKLKSLIDPFEQNINGIKISREDIKSALDKNHITSEESDSDIVKFINEVAFKVVNYKNEEIKIVVPESSDIDFNSAEILKEGLTYLAAAIFKGEDTVIANIEGNEKIIKTLLEVNLSKPDNIIVEKEEKFNFLNWDAHIDTLKQFRTENEDYSKKIVALQEENHEIIGNFLEEIPMENWNNKEFILKMLNANNNIINILPPEIVLQNNFLEVLASQEELDCFKSVFKSYLIKPLKLQIKTIENKLNVELMEVLPPKLKKLIDLENLENYKTGYNENISEELLTQSLDYVNNHVFNNLTMGLKLLKDCDLFNDFYEFLSEEVKFNPLIIDLIFIKRRSVQKHQYIYSPNIESHISKERGENIDWLKSFFNTYGENVQYHSIQKNPNAFVSWYEDKDKIKEIFSSKVSNEMHNLFELIPNKIINDNSVVQLTIKNCPECYRYLDSKNKKQFLEEFIENIDTLKNKNIYIINQDIYELKDKQKFLTLLEKGNQYWLEDPKCPKHLSEDIDFIFHKDVNFTKLLDNKKVVRTVLKDDKHIIEGLKRAKNFYSMLPYEKQLNVDFGLLALSNKNDSFNKPYHQHLLNSKRFCLEAIIIDKEVISEISPNLWNDKEFLVEICKIMDNDSNLANRILIEGNSKLTTLFETYEISSNYEEFMNSYILQINMNEKLQNKEIKKGKKI